MRAAAWLLVLASVAPVVAVAGETDRLGRAVRLDEAGHHDEARALLAEIVADEPTNHRALWNLGLVAMRDDNPDDAVRAFEQAIEVDGEAANYHLWRGYAYARKLEGGGWVRKLFLAPRVRRSFERAVELAPDNVKAREALMQYYRRAPGFLGGGEARAAEQAAALHDLAAGQGFLAVFPQKRRPDAGRLSSEISIPDGR